MIGYDSDGYPEGHPDAAQGRPGSNPNPGDSAPKKRERGLPTSKSTRGGKDRILPNSDPNHEHSWSYEQDHPSGHDYQAMAGVFEPEDYHLDHGSKFRDLEKEAGSKMIADGHRKAGISPSEAHPHPDESLPVRGDDLVGSKENPSGSEDHNDVGRLGPSKGDAGHYKNHLTGHNNAGSETWKPHPKSQAGRG